MALVEVDTVKAVDEFVKKVIPNGLEPLVDHIVDRVMEQLKAMLVGRKITIE